MSSIFFRPFKDDVWVVLAFILLVTFTVIFIPHYKFEFYDKTTAYWLASTSGWFLFVFINAYYGGALTMFFSSEITIDFNNIRDVMRAYPDWILQIKDGKTRLIKIKAYS